MTRRSGNWPAHSVEELRMRLRASVLHGAESERKDLEELFALSVSDRVEGGDCEQGLLLLGPPDQEGRIRLKAEGFRAKFREGDPLYLGNSDVVEAGMPVQFGSWDADRREISVVRDRFERAPSAELYSGSEYRLDRRGLGLERLLLEGLDSVFHPENRHVLDLLQGQAAGDHDEARRQAGRERGREVGFTEAQCEALAAAVSTEDVCLIQGPPGTGKTRVLAEIALFLAERRCRLFVSAFTHRAVDNVLLALRKISPELPLIKLGKQSAELRQAGVRSASKLDRLSMPEGAVVVGGTSFAARKFSRDRRFHFVLIDEAGQVPVVHGAIAMTQARRVILVGDPAQLPPVHKNRHGDQEYETSIHAFLETHYESVLLDRSFRMNRELCDVISDCFYEGRLLPSESSSDRRLTLREGGPLRELLDPEIPLLWARVDHLGRRRRSPEESGLIAEIVAALRLHHDLPGKEIAILTPYRAQIREIRSVLETRGLLDEDLVVDTVERMQGQEREVVVLSLVSSDRDDLERQASFFYQPGRLNVCLSRARSKCILVASKHAFRARLKVLQDFQAVSRFKALARSLHQVDMSRSHGGFSSRI